MKEVRGRQKAFGNAVYVATFITVKRARKSAPLAILRMLMKALEKMMQKAKWVFRLSNRILVTGHFERPAVKKLAAKAKGILHEKCKCVDIRKKAFGKAQHKAAVVLGGDGTLLRTVRKTKGRIPVLGIAAGSRNALMHVKPEKMEKTLHRLSDNRFSVEERLRLQAIVDGSPLPEALNEVLVVNKKSGDLAVFKLKAGQRLINVEADGVIFATPTGSSGHAFSAAGKRLAIGSNKLSVVPSNPLNRKMKPFYLEPKAKIRAYGFEKGEYVAVIDGKIRKKIGKELRIRRGENALFVKL